MFVVFRFRDARCSEEVGIFGSRQVAMDGISGHFLSLPHAEGLARKDVVLRTYSGEHEQEGDAIVEVLASSRTLTSPAAVYVIRSVQRADRHPAAKESAVAD